MVTATQIQMEIAWAIIDQFDQLPKWLQAAWQRESGIGGDFLCAASRHIKIPHPHHWEADTAPFNKGEELLWERRFEIPSTPNERENAFYDVHRYALINSILPTRVEHRNGRTYMVPDPEVRTEAEWQLLQSRAAALVDEVEQWRFGNAQMQRMRHIDSTVRRYRGIIPLPQPLHISLPALERYLPCPHQEGERIWIRLANVMRAEPLSDQERLIELNPLPPDEFLLAYGKQARIEYMAVPDGQGQLFWQFQVGKVMPE